MRTSFTLGTTFSETFSPAQCPASAGWVLSLRLVPRDGSDAAVTLTGSADGDSHLVEAAAAITTDWVSGPYGWVAFASLAGVVREIGKGEVFFAPNPFTTNGALETRSGDRIALDNIRAVLKGVASQSVLSYKINGRELQHRPIAELLALESSYVIKVQREDNKARIDAGLKTHRRVYLRLGNV